MSELTLRFGEARLHVEGDADLVARERRRSWNTWADWTARARRPVNCWPCCSGPGTPPKRPRSL